jgi:hypothetical protein
LEGNVQKGIEFSKERSEFYDLYRQKKLKRLKHIDVNGEKAGILGRIFKGKKKWITLEELLKSINIFIIYRPWRGNESAWIRWPENQKRNYYEGQ